MLLERVMLLDILLQDLIQMAMKYQTSLLSILFMVNLLMYQKALRGPC